MNCVFRESWSEVLRLGRDFKRVVYLFIFFLTELAFLFRFGVSSKEERRRHFADPNQKKKKLKKLEEKICLFDRNNLFREFDTIFLFSSEQFLIYPFNKILVLQF